ncbi:MAG: CHAT domain-containing protein [Myxococcales bacterium]|nr:CHAT domain-containing protein [Myxococcales bacterium]
MTTRRPAGGPGRRADAARAPWICALAVALLAALSGCRDAPHPYAEAEAAYARADFRAAVVGYRAALTRDDAPVPAHVVRARLGLALRKVGDNGAAEQVLSAAIAEAEAADDGHQAALARRYLGRLYADTGRPDDAQAAYDAALAWHRAHGPPSDVLKLQIQRAGLAWVQGDLETAYAAYLDAHGRAQVAEQPALRGMALDGMALLVGQVGAFEDAEGLLDQAALLYARAGRLDVAAQSRANAAVFAAMAGDHAEAARRATEALSAAQGQGFALVEAQAQVALAHARYGLGEVAAGRAAAAAGLAAVQAASLDAGLQVQARLAVCRGALLAHDDAAFEACAASLSGAELPAEAAGVLAGFEARRALRGGDAAAAEAALARAVEAYERARDAVGALDLAGWFVAERAWVYEALIDLRAGRSDYPGALAVVDRAKGRAFTEALLGDRPDEQGPDGLPAPRAMERAVNLAALRRPAAAARAGEVPADVAVIEVFLLPDAWWVFYTRDGATRGVRHPEGRAEVEAKVEAVLDAVRVGSARWRAPARWLAQRLVAPFAADLLGDAAPRALAVLPHGALHHLPFELLPAGDALLVDRLPVFSAANRAALGAAFAGPAPSPPRSVLAVGDPIGDLPGARLEVDEVARAFATAKTLTGVEAREGAVRRALAGADVVHFAVHGVRPAPHAPAYLELQRDGRHDGRLYADELATLPVQARLVTLSVCDSARGRANRGDEIVGVVDRAFLLGGARTVVASRWPVHDAASVLFMRVFYAQLFRTDALTAFHRAQQALRRGELRPDALGEQVVAALGTSRAAMFRGVRPARFGQDASDFTHPYFWAAFTLRGDPR